MWLDGNGRAKSSCSNIGICIHPHTIVVFYISSLRLSTFCTYRFSCVCCIAVRNFSRSHTRPTERKKPVVRTHQQQQQHPHETTNVHAVTRYVRYSCRWWGVLPFSVYFLVRWTLMMKYVTTTTIHTRVPHLCTYFLYYFCCFLLLFFYPLSRVCIVVVSLRLIRYGRGKKIRSACNASGQDLYANQLLRRTQYYECVLCVCVYCILRCC